MTSERDRELTGTARRDFEQLDEHTRDRIVTNLEEIITDERRDPYRSDDG
ncbi:hypothetical protein [Halobellus rarus]|uniref:Uncharacterized protein n=1 Tax=Halobellus rarus TaxID=1126237 RepID=A0ABD6CL25_9EURY|nr:hypothetical protein [Halobellus rarus]